MSEPPSSAGPPKALAVVSGAGQEGEVGTELAQPLVFRVTDSTGRAVPGVVVTFDADAAPVLGHPFGRVDPSNATTDEDGIVRARWTLGSRAGRQELRAAAAAANGPRLTLGVEAKPGPATSLRAATATVAAITVGDSLRFAVAGVDRYGNATSRLGEVVWHLHDPAVAHVSRVDIAPDPAATVVARAAGATALEARHAALGPVRFDLRVYAAGPGRDIAFASFTDASRQTPGIYLLSADGASTRLLTQQYATDPAWSPDGRRIAFTGRLGSTTAIYVMNADGSGVRALTDESLQGAAQPAWSPDGSRIAFAADNPTLGVGGSSLFVMNADGSAPTRFAAPDEALCNVSCLGARRPAWSPDGTRIAYTYQKIGSIHNPPTIYLVRADGTFIRALGGGFASEPGWSPDGTRIAIQNGTTLMASPVLSIGLADIYVVSADSFESTRLTYASGGSMSDASPAWSPDHRIAFGRIRAHAGLPIDFAAELFVMNADGSDVRRVTAPPGGVSRPAWRPGP